jgi:hypothetical protein
LESLGYVLIYFLKGSLPWQGLQVTEKEKKYDAIMKKKMFTQIDELCRGLPREFNQYLEYTRKLRFDDKPDYSFLKKLFREVSIHEGFTYDHVYDWVRVCLGLLLAEQFWIHNR